MTIRWITPALGTAPAASTHNLNDVIIVDVRDLVDKAGNPAELVREKIRRGEDALRKGCRVVVCCDYGMSRSNAVAVGILTQFEGLDFETALRKVQETTGENRIKSAPLNTVRAALGFEDRKQIGNGQRTILVTGASGFLGQALATRLAGEFKILAPTRQEIDIVQGTTQLDLLVGATDTGMIVHLANPAIHTSNVAMGEAITMLRNVIDVCLARDIPLIFPSCWEIYAGYSGTLKVTEETPAFPKGTYGETKYLSEILLEHNHRTNGLKRTILRSGPVYGPGSDKPRFIYNFIEKALKSEVIVTHQYLNGEPALDLLHVNDFIAAMGSVIHNGYTGVLNIGTGTLTSTYNIAEMLVARLGGTSRLEKAGINADTARIAMDYRRAEAELGWRPTLSFAQGLEDILKTTNTGA